MLRTRTLTANIVNERKIAVKNWLGLLISGPYCTNIIDRQSTEIPDNALPPG